MQPATRVEVTKQLKQLGRQVAAAEALLMAGDYPAAIRDLLEARRLGNQTIAALIAGCLRRSLAEVNSTDWRRRQAGVDEFIGLVDFVESTLCPTCRRQLATKLKRT